MSAEEAVKCEGCGKGTPVFCETCGNHDDCADPGDVCDHGGEFGGDPGTLIGEWFERERLLHGLSPEVVAVFERCISDLEER